MKKQYFEYQTTQPRKLQLIKICPEFNWEVIAETLHPNHYLDNAKRRDFKVTFRNGIALDEQGWPLTGRYLFVLLLENGVLNCYACREKQVRNHSYLAGGQPVAGTGYLDFSNGSLTKISNESGHYKPKIEQMFHALVFFLLNSKNKGLKVEVHSKPHEDKPVKVRFFNALDIIKMPTKYKKHKLAKEPDPTISRFGGKPWAWKAKVPLPETKITSQSLEEYETNLEIVNPVDLINSVNTNKSNSVPQKGGYDEVLVSSKKNLKKTSSIQSIASLIVSFSALTLKETHDNDAQRHPTVMTSLKKDFS